MDTLKTIYGDLYTPNSSIDLITSYLTNFGEWAWIETQFCSQFISSSSIVYDVGSFLGTFSLGIAHKEPKSILAIEPNQYIYPYLKNNFESLIPSLSTKWQTLNLALGNSSDEKKYHFTISDENLGASHFQFNGLDKNDTIFHSLKELRTRYGNYDFLKLDVEGMELDIISTDFDWIKTNQPTIWLECNDKSTSIDLYYSLSLAGFDVYYFSYPAFRKNNYNNNIRPINPCAFEAGLLGVKQQIIPKHPNNLTSNDCILKKIESKNDLEEIMFRTPRWGLIEWEMLSRPELMGLLSRLYSKQEFNNFYSS